MKNVLITGGATGIGRACVRLFCEKGYNVIFTYNSSHACAENLINELEHLGKKVIGVRVDLSNSEEVSKAFDLIYSKVDKIDVVVNNAGISCVAQIQDTSEIDYDKVFAINTKAVYLVNNYALKTMLTNKYGRIINVSSMWGERGASCEVVYSASKSAIIGYTKALAKEVGLSGITVNCVLPGVIDTKMNDCFSDEIKKELAESTALGRIGQPEEVANLICFLASDEASFITAQSIGIDGGFIG